MEGRWFSKWGSRFGAADIRLKSFATVTGMEGGSFSKWGSRLGAADIRLKSLQQLEDGGRFLVKMGLSPWRRGHSS